jgi:hypothetical protein
VKLHAAGTDRTESLGQELERAATALRAPDLEARIHRETPVLALGKSENEQDYTDRYLAIVRSRACVDPSSFVPPAGRGLKGRLAERLRRFLWKLTGHQHEWISRRQNAVNLQLVYELEFEIEARRQQVAELEARIRELEARLPGKEPA